MEDKWINDIKNRLTDFEMEVPTDLWDSVNPENGQKVTEVKTNNRAFLYRMAAAAAVLAGILTMGLLYISQDDSNMDLKPYTALNGNTVKTANTENNLNHLAESSRGNAVNVPFDKESRKSVARNIMEEESSGNVNPEINTAINDETADNQSDTHSDMDLGQKEDSAAHEEPKAKLSLLDPDYKYPITRQKRGKNKKSGHGGSSDKFSFGVMTSAGSFGHDGDSDVFSNGPYDQPNQGQDNPGSNNPGFDNPGQDSNQGNNNGETDGSNGNDSDDYDESGNGDDGKNTRSPSGQKGAVHRSSRPSNSVTPDDKTDEITHHMPVKLGITFLYRLSDKIGVETGLTYTYLASDVRYGNRVKSGFIDATQSLHYIGIPVNVKYRPLHWRWADVYLSGGMQFDKCVSSFVNGRYARSSSGIYAKRVSLGEKPFQVSANVSVGLQFNITPYLGIYAEPGISYYFNDGSSLSTFYKEHPFNFNINAGLRLSIGSGIH